MIWWLTCDGQIYDVACRRRGGYLTFILPRVRLLHRFNLQQVILGEGLMNGLEPEIRGVGQPADGQQLQVPVADPRHGLVAHVLHPAVQQRGLAQNPGHVARVLQVEAGGPFPDPPGAGAARARGRGQHWGLVVVALEAGAGVVDLPQVGLDLGVLLLAVVAQHCKGC